VRLTRGAEVAAALADNDSFDHGSAAATFFSRASIDFQIVLVISPFSIRIQEILQGSSSVFQASDQYPGNRPEQPLFLGQRQSSA